MGRPNISARSSAHEGYRRPLQACSTSAEEILGALTSRKSWLLVFPQGDGALLDCAGVSSPPQDAFDVDMRAQVPRLPTIHPFRQTGRTGLNLQFRFDRVFLKIY